MFPFTHLLISSTID